MSSGLDFGALSLGVARFVLCGSSSQLYRAVPGSVSDWHQPVGVGSVAELSWGTKWGAPCGGALGPGLGTCVGLFVSLDSADCYCMARIDGRFSGKTLSVVYVTDERG